MRWRLLRSRLFALGPSGRGVVKDRVRSVDDARTRPSDYDKISQGAANMDDHETRRKIIREWMALPTDKRHTAEQAAAFAKKAVQQNELHRSRRDPDRKFRRDPYQKLMGWLLPRAGKS